MNKLNRIPSVQALVTTAGLAVTVLFASDACTYVTNTTAVQCLSEAECLDRGPEFANTTCSGETKTCIPVVQNAGLCATNVECTERNGGTTSICRKRDKKCVVLQTAECPVVYGKKTELEDDKAVVIGIIDAASGGELGLLFNKVYQYVQEDLSLATAGLPSVAAGTGTRPLVLVSCNEFGAGIEGLQRAARHLVDDVGVPAILGPIDSQNVLQVAAPILLPNKIMSIPPVSGLSALNDLPNPIAPTPLIWRLATSDAQIVKVVGPFVKDVLAQRAIDLGIRLAGEPLRVMVFHEGNVIGVATQKRVQEILFFNGKSAVANSQDTPPNYAVTNFGDFNDPTNNPNPSKRVTTALQQVFAFKPHIVIHSSNIITVPKTFGAMEALWPSSSGPRPIHVAISPSWVASTTIKLATDDTTTPSLRSRLYISGGKQLAGTERFGTFFLNFKQRFPEFAAVASNPLIPQIYDSAYLMIYAIAAVGSKPLTGENIAVAMSRLGPPGTPIQTESDQFAMGFGALAAGGNIDLDGLSGSLDFDLKEGGIISDSQINCPTVSGTTVTGFKPSKYSYSAAKNAGGFDPGVTAIDCP